MSDNAHGSSREHTPTETARRVSNHAWMLRLILQCFPSARPRTCTASVRSCAYPPSSPSTRDLSQVSSGSMLRPRRYSSSSSDASARSSPGSSTPGSDSDSDQGGATASQGDIMGNWFVALPALRRAAHVGSSRRLQHAKAALRLAAEKVRSCVSTARARAYRTADWQEQLWTFAAVRVRGRRQRASSHC